MTTKKTSTIAKKPTASDKKTRASTKKPSTTTKKTKKKDIEPVDEVEIEPVIEHREYNDSDKRFVDTFEDHFAADMAIDTELNENQKLFCIYYLKYFNAVKAYQKAYNSSLMTAKHHAYRLFHDPKINRWLRHLKTYKLSKAMLEPGDIFQQMIDFAFSDITDFVDFGTDNDENGNPTRNYMTVKNSAEIDGRLIQSITNGKEGLNVKMVDKFRALEWLGDRMDLMPTVTRARLEVERQKLAQEQGETPQLAAKLNDLIADIKTGKLEPFADDFVEPSDIRKVQLRKKKPLGNKRFEDEVVENGID